jgi:hypothetical protein
MHKKMVYKKDYIENKKFIVYKGKLDLQCLGSKLVKGGGYHPKSCTNKIKEGDKCYIKNDCECQSTRKFYCSEECCWNKCHGCKRKICGTCYLYRDSNCVYCAHKGEECDCDSQEYFCGDSSSGEESEKLLCESEPAYYTFFRLTNDEMMTAICTKACDPDYEENCIPSFIPPEIIRKWAITILLLGEENHSSKGNVIKVNPWFNDEYSEKLGFCKQLINMSELKERYVKYKKQELEEIREEFSSLVKLYKKNY